MKGKFQTSSAPGGAFPIADCRFPIGTAGSFEVETSKNAGYGLGESGAETGSVTLLALVPRAPRSVWSRACNHSLARPSWHSPRLESISFANSGRCRALNSEGDR